MVKAQMSEVQEGNGLRTVLVVACLMVGLLLPLPRAHADDPNRKSPITLERDKDRTVYSIGPSDKEATGEDTEKAWDMLKGVLIDTRGSSGKGPDHNR
jgi:hypothetical protein